MHKVDVKNESCPRRSSCYTRGVRKDEPATKSDIGAVKSDIGAAKSAVGAVKADIKAVKVDVKALQTDMNTVKSDIRRLGRRVDAVETGLRHNSLLLEDMGTKLDGLIDVIKEMRREMATKADIAEMRPG